MPELEKVTEQLSSERLINEYFHPTLLTDDKGFKRAIFHSHSRLTHQDMSFSFRGVYELPLWDKGGARADIGSVPIPGIFSDDEFDAYKNEFGTPGKLSENKVHFQTTRDFKGFVRLVGLISPNSPIVQQIMTEMTEVENGGEYSQISIDIMNAILAAGMINDQGQVNIRFDNNAEALVLLSLSGNKQAAEVLDMKTAALKNLYSEIKEERTKGYFLEGVKTRDVSHDLLFHVMPEVPDRDRDGNIILRPLYQSIVQEGALSASVNPRDSIHFTIGGPVAAHEGGNWQGKEYVVIAKAEPNLKKEECTGIRAEDVRFEVYPSQELKLSDAWLVRPAQTTEEIPEDTFFQIDRDTNTVIYRKPKELTVRQFQKLLEEQKGINAISVKSGYNKDWEPAEIEVQRPLEVTISSIALDWVSQSRVLHKLGIHSNDLPYELIKSANNRMKDSEDANMADELRRHLPKDMQLPEIENEILSIIQTEIRNFAVREAIKVMGEDRYEPPMGEGWQDTRDAPLAKYAIEVLDRESVNAFRSPEGILERKVVDSFIEANPSRGFLLSEIPSWLSGEESRDDRVSRKKREDRFLWEEYDPHLIPIDLLTVSPQMRATIYDAGILNSRRY